MSDPYLDPDRPTDERVADLLERMTLEEKVGQLLVAPCTGGVDEVIAEVRANVEEHHLGQASPFGREDAPDTPEGMIEVANAIQEHAVEETRLGIPLLLIANAVHGNAYAKGAAVFPHNLGMGATRDEGLVERAAEATAHELAATGVHQNYDPICDVGREQRWGRVFETFGESTRLCGRLGAAKVRGYQGDGVEREDAVLATPKHFPAYGQPDCGEDAAVNELSASTFRRLHLPAFAAPIAAGAEAVMPCYNSIDGLPVHGSRAYLGDLLDELDFEGFVVSDHHGVRMLHHEHGTAADQRDAVAQSVAAGMDAYLDVDVGEHYFEHLVDLVASGDLEESTLDERVRRILAAKFRLGLFEDPYVDPERAAGALLTDEHRALALEAARKAVVLLENDGMLPLDADADLLVSGPTADELDFLFGGWSSSDNEVGSTVREGLEVVGDGTVTCREGAGIRGTRDLDAAREAARDADAAVVCVGESQYIHEFGLSGTAGETGAFPTRTELDLPPAQRELVEAVADTGTPTVVVLVSGRPLAIASTAEVADALLFAGYPGGEGGQAIAEILLGEVDPSGAMPISMPRSAAHLPTRFNHFKQPAVIGPHQHPDSYDPLYPFGHGEHYTDFAVSDLRLSPAEVGHDGTVEATVTVENVGDRAGATALDCFVTDEVASRVTPVRELADFGRVHLDAGERADLTFSIPVGEFGVLGECDRRRVEPGTFTVRVADLDGQFAVVDG